MEKKTRKIRPPKHAWAFKKSIKPNTFSWKSSQVACKKLKEALSEIKKVARTDGRLAAYGITDLAERIWPALEHVDSSSGSLGNTVSKTLEACVPLFVNAQIDSEERQILLERLFDAIQEDGVDYLCALSENWGELCATKELASSWVDFLLPTVRACLEDRKDRKISSYFAGKTLTKILSHLC